MKTYDTENVRLPRIRLKQVTNNNSRNKLILKNETKELYFTISNYKNPI